MAQVITHVKVNSAARKKAEQKLVSHARAGNPVAQQELIERYRPALRIVARSFRLQSGDEDDLHQEGRIGLFKAIQNFDESRNLSFSTFASVCMRRQIISALRTAHSRRHGALNNSVPMDDAVFDVPADGTPEQQLLAEEEVRDLQGELLTQLTTLEYRVLNEYLAGKPYQAMAGELELSLKAIDNALHRIKQKLETILQSHPISSDVAASAFQTLKKN